MKQGPRRFELAPCVGGINNCQSPNHAAFQVQRVAGGGTAPPKYVRSVIDLDIDNDGVLSTRAGVVEHLYTTNLLGLWSIDNRLLCQVAGTLYGDNEILISGLARKVELCQYGGMIFGTDGTVNFVIEGSSVYPWGLPTPIITTTVASGSLEPGNYLVQASWIDERGNEHGVSSVQAIELIIPGSVVVSASSPPIGAVNLAVYVSHANQKHTSFVAAPTIAALPYTIAAHTTEVDPPKTEIMTGPWVGIKGVVSWRSFIFIWRDNVVVHSEALEPHLFHPDSIWQFPSTVKFVQPVNDGVWVGTSTAVWWVSGKEINEMVPIMVSNFPCYQGSDTISGELVPSLETTGPVALFIADRKLMAGLQGGKMVSLMDGTYRFPSASKVTFAYIYNNGVRQLIVALEN